MKYSTVLVAALAAIAEATVPIPKGGVVGQPITEAGKGAVFSGGTNRELDLQNPSNINAQPPSDNGLVPNMKWSFSLSKTRMFYGGWIREQVIQDLPTSHDIAGAQVHLIKGGIRQMHWHRVAEWAYIYAGSFLISAVNEEGKFQLDKLGVGDMYYFPKGMAHSLQGLEDENEILLIFDDGDFDRVGTTFMVSDWISHTPRDVLAKNFGVPLGTFDKTYNPDPALINSTISTRNVTGPKGTLSGNSSFTFHIDRAPEMQVPGNGGTMQIVDSRNFPVSKTIACSVVRLKPRGMRELHWHPTSEEWLYFHSGNARATVYMGGALARTFDFTAGDVGVFPDNAGHYVENTSDTEELVYIEIFKADRIADVSLSQWLALTPADIAATAINVPIEVIEQIKKDKQYIIE